MLISMENRMDINSISPETIYLGIVVVALSTLLSTAATVVFIWDKFRRKPSIDETLNKDFLTKEEFKEHIKCERAEFLRHEDHNKSEFKQLHEKLQNDIQVLRSYNAKTTKGIFEELRRMSTSFNKEFQDINKSLGRLEGEIKASKKD